MRFAGKTVVLCVTGGIAAYKAADLTSKLHQNGAEVRVLMTESAALASEICSTSHGKLRSKVSTTARLPESVSNVMGEMNCAADSVMSTRTSAPF